MDTTKNKRSSNKPSRTFYSVLKSTLARLFGGSNAAEPSRSKQGSPKTSGHSASTSTNKGTVKFFNRVKGFGFIEAEDGNTVFVHISGLKCRIKPNDTVQFEIAETKKGPSAVNVRLA